MASTALDFLVSAMTEHNPFMGTDAFPAWFEERKQAHRFVIEEIRFCDMDKWGFEPATGNLGHVTGKFFTIEGIWVETNYGSIPQWSQPIINQPEVGILGILAKRFNGVLYFLMQVKMEPGNINMVQLAPTLQATRSNYTRAHKGKSPPYLEYFLEKSDARILVDSLQSEQGARFLRKRNRNIIIETTKDVPVLDDYCWLTLGQIQRILQRDNVVNMDARTVLSCIPASAPEIAGTAIEDVPGRVADLSGIPREWLRLSEDPFTRRLLESARVGERGLHGIDDILSWMTELKVRYELNVEQIPLKFTQDWRRTDSAIGHVSGKFFSVIAVRVEADNREVGTWTQPLVRPADQGIVAFLTKTINGTLHFLIQGKVEPGDFDVVEMAPTVQCLTGSYRDAAPGGRPAFLDDVLDASSRQTRISSLQSEEGGRFFREENKNVIIELDDNYSEHIPDEYIWMTLGQLKQFTRFNNYVNVQARCLLSNLALI
jgi:oxidase EvaA